MSAASGAMVVSAQGDALRLEGTESVKQLVTSRLYAALVSLPLFTLAAAVMAMGGGVLIAVFSLGLHPLAYELSA